MPIRTKTRIRTLQNYLKLNDEVYEDIRISQYQSNAPIHVLDFGSNTEAYYSFTSSLNLDTVNAALQSRFRRTPSSENLYSSEFICIIKSSADTSIARISGLIYKQAYRSSYSFLTRSIRTVYSIYKCKTVQILRRFRSYKLPPCIANISCRSHTSLVNVGTVNDKEVFDFVYPSIHNLYCIDNNLFLSVDVNKYHYLATDIADYLSSISNYLKIATDDPNLEVRVKLNIRSPGNICFEISNILQYFVENPEYILALYLFLFSDSSIQIGNNSISVPSLPNILKFLSNLKHTRKLQELERKKQELEIEALEEQNRTLKIDNDIQEQAKKYQIRKQKLEVEALQEENRTRKINNDILEIERDSKFETASENSTQENLLNNAQDIVRLSQQLNVTAVDDPSLSPLPILKAFDELGTSSGSSFNDYEDSI